MDVRICGECRACCTFPIARPDLSEAAVPCPKVCSSGCSIQASKPQWCKDYRCAWLEGWGDEAERPDKTGVVITLLDSEVILAFSATETFVRIPR